jgi:hypothetical protein
LVIDRAYATEEETDTSRQQSQQQPSGSLRESSAGNSRPGSEEKTLATENDRTGRQSAVPERRDKGDSDDNNGNKKERVKRKPQLQSQKTTST